jgi:hypothetical protein
LNAGLFALFLAGKDTGEIHRLNPALSLGQIVEARISGNWDARRDEYLDKLLTETATNVQRASLEAATFISDLLTVANKEHGDKLKRYLQTGNPKELGDFKIDNLTQLKVAIETLQKLTGADKKSVVNVSGEVLHRPVASVEEPATRTTPGESAAILKLLLGDGK